MVVSRAEAIVRAREAGLGDPAERRGGRDGTEGAIPG
jgi:hypothetical protein